MRRASLSALSLLVLFGTALTSAAEDQLAPPAMKSFDFNKDIPSLDLGDPLIVEPRRGDVLFFQHLFGHNGTANTLRRPRFMMRYFCRCESCFTTWKKTEEWGHWTP